MERGWRFIISSRKKQLDPKTQVRGGFLVDVATKLRAALGETIFKDHTMFHDRVDAVLKQAGDKRVTADLKRILKAVSRRVESEPPVMAKVQEPDNTKADLLRGLREASVKAKPARALEQGER